MQSTTASKQPVLAAATMRAAEAHAMASGISAFALMTRAGESAAEAITAFCGPASVLVLAGPGNNGGDGYIAARALRVRGWPVRIAATSAPATATAREAAALWDGAVDSIDVARPAAILVDALFGIGLTRGLDAGLVGRIEALGAAARVTVALDLPSGVASDDGALLSPTLAADLTIAFGALKPAHLLFPAAAKMGRIVVADIGLGILPLDLFRNAPPRAATVDRSAHKYQRGHVVVAGGTMPGAAWLAARAAQRAGAGYVTLTGDAGMLAPSSLVGRALGEIAAEQVGAVVVGPGLGRDAAARQVAEAALALGRPTVIDADMFSVFAAAPSRLAGRNDVMTPHEGEFARFFGELPGSKVDRARAAAANSGNLVVLKGPDTVIAAPDGRAAINDHASPLLATAGSGDVLAGMIAAHLALGEAPFDAACAAVWRHGDAARRGRDGLVAEDLLDLIAR